MSINWNPATIAASESLADTLFQVSIEVAGRSSFDYDPGQYVILNIPDQGKPSEKPYYFSIASAPDGSDTFELLIRTDKQDPLHHILQSGERTELLISDAAGSFYRPESFDRGQCFICIGTGIAPFRSMLSLWLNKNVACETCLIQGARSFRELAFYDEFSRLSEAYPAFDYHPVLSNESPEAWKGEHGRVHDIYRQKFAKRPPTDFYLCGSKEMITQTTNELQSMGYALSDIHLQQY